MSPEDLTEEYVQNAAVDWLVSKYQDKPGVQAALPELEVKVSSKSRLGWGRADGLITAQLKDGTIQVASLEAKSSKRLFNLVPWYGDERWLIHAVLVGAVGLVVAGWIGWTLGGWFLKWVLPLLVFFGVGFLYLVVTSSWSYYRVIDVIAQVKRYPANEQWIALSTDAYNLLKPEQQQTLRGECEKEGIGLIRVSAGESVTQLVDPRTKGPSKCYEDFLACYAREKTIREKLQAEVEASRDIVAT